jgi:hypothetical protein
MALSTFIDQVKNKGLARTNRYTVSIGYPGDSMSIAGLLCDAVNLPGMNYATTPNRIFGEVREVPYERGFDPVTLTFYVDAEEMKVKKVFDDWMAAIMNPRTRVLGYYRDYVKDIAIAINTVDDQTPYVLTLYEAYPKTIAPIQLDYNSRDVMKLSVTFSYKYWNTSGLEAASGTAPPSDLPAGDPQSAFTNTGTSTGGQEDMWLAFMDYYNPDTYYE